MKLVNLTPHPIRIYGWKVPDRFNLGDYEPTTIIEPSGEVARIGEIELGTQYMGLGTPVEYVEYRHAIGLPPYVGHDESRDRDTWYVVSLALALALVEKRGDLLVPFREVRNREGTVIGCRSLARPV
ncbi:hypothetical protein ABGB07_36225 [Micromonosporaceae bacterium B7E4]